MHAGGGRFARGIEAGQGSESVEIGANAAHRIMRGGTNRNQIAADVDSISQASGIDAGEVRLHAFGVDVR